MSRCRVTLLTMATAFVAACPASSAAPSRGGYVADGAIKASLPLVLVADIDLPGKSARFDYQDIDVTNGHLVIAHMGDASLVVTNVVDGSVVGVLRGIPTPRGVVVAGDIGRIFVTSAPNKLVIIDARSLSELSRVTTGRAPDGVGWDPTHQVVGVSDQGEGSLSLIANAGAGRRKQVRLGSETGNVVFDSPRGVFWITVLSATQPDRLVAVDPVEAQVTTSLELPGCAGAHGLKIHPDGKSALVACEANATVVRVALDGEHVVSRAPVGADPDVLAIDPGLGWLFVASESGDLAVFDLGKPGLVAIDREHPGAASHSVAVDPRSHRVFFPLVAGPKGTPVLRIMKPAGT